MSFFEDASLVLIPSAIKDQKVYSVKPTDGTGDLTFSRASTATRVNASGLIESVASGVPRLDYTDSTCPKLLLEPQRTNYLTYSNDFTNAAYAKQGVTLTSGQADPFGGTSAWKLQLAAGASYLGQGGFTSALRTASIWMRADAATTVGFSFGNTTTGSANVTTTWQRFTFTANEINGIQVDNYFGVSPANQPKTVYIYQGQVEDGSYATSIIPTTTAAVTRLADAASKTGISSLIGQTAGTIFVDFVWRGRPATLSDNAIFSIGVQEYGTSNIAISNYNSALYARVTNGVSIDAAITFGTMTAGTRYKAAIAYANNDVVFYVNGASYGSDTSVSIPAVSNVNFQNAFTNAKDINQALLFKTRLTNAQLAELTTL
jgi:hypothetical protein